MAQSLALSSSTKNSEKTESGWLQFPPRSYRSSSSIVQWRKANWPSENSLYGPGDNSSCPHKSLRPCLTILL